MPSGIRNFFDKTVSPRRYRFLKRRAADAESGAIARSRFYLPLWVILFAGTGVTIWLAFTSLLLVAGETQSKAITVGAIIGWCEALAVFTFGYQARKWLRSMKAKSGTKQPPADSPGENSSH